MAAPETRPQLTIRLAREADAAALREIFNEAVEDGLATFDAAPRSIEDQRRLIAAGERDPRYPLFLAEVRGWACGTVAIEPHDERRGLDDMAEIVIFVRRSFRSYGVGRQLMRVAQTEAARLGLRKLVGRMLADNHDGLRLCQATGWRVVGTHERHARHDDRLRDVVVVEYIVSPDFDGRVMTDAEGMRLALNEARAAAEKGEVPVGAVIAIDERVVGRGANRTITDCDPTAHAEIIALREASRALGNYRLTGAVLYVTVEPCAMCAGAMIQARIARLVYGCDEPKGGAARSCFSLFEHPALNHRVAVTPGVLDTECVAILQSFFAARR